MMSRPSTTPIAPGAVPQADAPRLIALFDATFAATDNTRLEGGGEEPVYYPAGADRAYHRIIFTRDYAASALHEIAHWCIAGRARRQQLDYGYWYAPDGRDAAQQRAFEQVEVKPQALEWILSTACGRRFRVSADNLDGQAGDLAPFKDAIHAQVVRYCHEGIPPRAARFVAVLSAAFASGDALDPARYQRAAL